MLYYYDYNYSHVLLRLNWCDMLLAGTLLKSPGNRSNISCDIPVMFSLSCLALLHSKEDIEQQLCSVYPAECCFIHEK